MASPPYRSPATSPPYPPHISLPNPKKRPSLNVHPGPSKRRKQASIRSSSSVHPLRQTSFPPEETAPDTALRSPSVESDFTGVTGGRSVLTAGTGKKRRGKGKKRDASGSLRSGGKTADGARRETSEVPDDDEDEDEGAEGLLDDGEEMDKAAERKNLAILVDAFNADQTDRYEMYRRVKLRKETVRKIANQTLSTSVPAPVITTINGYTKTFIGTLIERARAVQSQWSAIETPPDTPPQTNPIPIDPTDFHQANPNNDIFSTDGGSVAGDPARSTAAAGDHENQRRDVGPLMPDHLREALRRHRRDGEGGGTGMAGVSVGLGLAGTGAARLQGRRLFR